MEVLKVFFLNLTVLYFSLSVYCFQNKALKYIRPTDNSKGALPGETHLSDSIFIISEV